MKKVGISICFALLGVVMFFYVIPIWNFKRASKHIHAITNAIASRNEQAIKEELLQRLDARTLEEKQIYALAHAVKTNTKNQVKGELWSSDDIIISVLNDTCETRLVLSQRGIFSQWKLVNMRYIKQQQ